MRYFVGAIVGLWVVLTLIGWGIAEMIRGLIMLLRRKEKNRS